MFEYNQPQQMVQQVVRAWVDKNLEPNREKLDTGELLPYDLIKSFCREFGISSMAQVYLRSHSKGSKSEKPEPKQKDDDSGGGVDPMVEFILAREISRVSPGFAMALFASLGAGYAILLAGADETKRELGFPIFAGEKIGAWALTETESGSDAFGSMKTVAKPADGGYRISGQKAFISNGPYADTYVVYAKLAAEGLAPGERPVKAFVVERGIDGFEQGPAARKMGMHDSPTGELFLDEVFVPEQNRLGKRDDDGPMDEEEGRKAAKATLQHERSIMPAMCTGIIERCLEASLAFARERRAFGRNIVEYQTIQNKLATMYVALENANNLLVKLAWLARNKKLDFKSACAAKWYCSRMAVDCALEAIQIHGGTGYMAEAGIEKLMRDAKMLEIGGGTSEIQLLSIARELLEQ